MTENKNKQKLDEYKSLLNEGGDDEEEESNPEVLKFVNPEEGNDFEEGEFGKPREDGQKGPPNGFPNFGIPDPGCCWLWILIIILLVLILLLVIMIILKATGSM